MILEAVIGRGPMRPPVIGWVPMRSGVIGWGAVAISSGNRLSRAIAIFIIAPHHLIP